MQAIILAGGKGTRLKPFTNAIPKPLVPLGDMPILEIVLRQLKHYGFEDIVLTVNHLSELIKAFFGDGSKLGLNIEYSLEERTLGTAGPIKLVENLDDNFLVLNGDLLTTLDFSDIYKSHCSDNATATIGTFQKEVKIDLGVLKTDNGSFVDYIEKPTYNYTVSMGVYVLNKSVIKFIPENEKFDMPELLLQLHKTGHKISCYTGEYDWLDIGRVDDYERAVNIFENNKTAYLF